MKKTLCLSVFALLMLSAAAAFAATDVTGAWSGAAKGPNGDFQLTFNFKQDGTKLTGSVTGPQGDPLEITNGKIDGDKLSFTVSFNGMNITHDGVVKSADEISLKSKADQGGFPDMEMTLKRSK
jgi:hypothetical protein